jgi:succinate dehydrogenase / fumarate reductase iron-sulfur subunit
MTDAMRHEGFGNCSNHYDCEAACPKGISAKFIAQLNREYGMALPKRRKEKD